MNQELLSQLDNPDPKVRRLATKELRSVVDPSVRKALLLKLSDTDEFVRRNAVIGLGNWDEAEIVDAILPLIGDEGFEVRCAVIQVLCKFSCQTEKIIGGLRRRIWDILQFSVRLHRKRGAEAKEHDLLRRCLNKIDPNIWTWLDEQYASKSKQVYLNMLEETKQRIDQTYELEKEAASSLLDSEKDVSIRRKAAYNLGSVYFDRYILSYIFENASELRYLPGRSLRGSLGIRVNFDFDSWVSVANAFDLRFKADGAEPILNALMLSAINDEHNSVRYSCVHVLRALKDERSITELKTVDRRYADTADDEGEEAREAVHEIEAAAKTVLLPRMTSETFGKLALKLK